MQDVSPGIAIGTFVGGIFTVLKLVVEVIKWRNNKRLRDAERTIPASIRPPPMPAEHAPQLTHELRLQAKEIELMRAQYQIDQLNQKLTDAQRREAQLSAKVTEQELLNQQLVAEMAELRRQGGVDADDYGHRVGAGGSGRRAGRADARDHRVRAPGGPGDRSRR